MAATLVGSDLNTALRVLYEDNSTDPTLKVHKLLSWMDYADKEWCDNEKRLPVKTGNHRGTRTTYTAAAAATVAATAGGFTLAKVELFDAPKVGMALVEGAMSKQADRFFKMITDVIDQAKNSQLDVLGRNVYRSQYGVFSRVTSGTSSPITVGDGSGVVYAQDIYSVEVGDTITASANADMSSPKSGTGLVTAVDKIAGTITYTGTITSLAVGDYLAIDGVVAVASGLLTWSPATNLPTDTLFGLARSGKTYTHGRYLNLTGESADGVWERVASQMQFMATKPDIFAANPEDMANFKIASASKRQITGNKYDFGMEVTEVCGLPVLEDPDCPRGYIFGVPKSYGIHSLGDVPKIVDADGVTLLRIAADSCEARIVSRFQYAPEDPSCILTVAVPV